MKATMFAAAISVTSTAVLGYPPYQYVASQPYAEQQVEQQQYSFAEQQQYQYEYRVNLTHSCSQGHNSYLCIELDLVCTIVLHICSSWLNVGGVPR